MTRFAPVGDGRVLAYMFARDGQELRYLRGTNILRVGDTCYAAVDHEVLAGDFDLPPLGGATRAVAVDRIPDLPDRAAVSGVYARSVLVIALHQEVSGAFLAPPEDDVVLAHALDVCGERGAAEAFFAWALSHRRLDGLLMWGLERHVRFVHRTALRERYERLRAGPGPAPASEPPADLPQDAATWIGKALARRNDLDLFTTQEGIDLRAHAMFMVCVHALVPKLGAGDDFFFAHLNWAQDMRRARALYGGAFHAGLASQGEDPRLQVEVRSDLEPSTVTVRPAAEGRYRLKVKTRQGTVWASDADPRPGGQEFVFSPRDEPLPAWLPDAVIYQIMVDRFARTKGDLPKPGSPTALYGGTLDGVREHLDHIASIGCNTIWLTPVHQTPSHHGYDHEDYYTVEPRYGGESALKRLIHAAHDRGMRVLLDFVPNHTGRGHRMFREALTRDGDAASFYRFWQWPHYYRCFGDDITLPELDTGSRQVQEYLVMAAQHWITEYGADGVRCDHVAGADPAFWVELRRGVRAIKPDALVLGEATGHAEWLARYAGRIDAIFDFDFAHVAREAFARGRMSPVDLAAWLDAHDNAFPGLALATLLDNHDMARFLWMAGGDRRRLKLAAAFLMTMPGMPVIYYGTEVGLSQRDDGSRENAELRLPMLWGHDQDADLLAHFQRLGNLRRESAALRRGSRRTLHVDQDELVYERVLGDRRMVVSLNLKSLQGTIVDESRGERLRQDDVLGVGPDQGPG